MATAAKSTNWFAIWTSVGVIAVLVAIGGIVLGMNDAEPEPTETPQSAIINDETGAISVGSGPNTFATYIDFMCPICNSFEQVYGPAIQGLVADGTITLEIHPVAILDSKSQGTAYSSRAASAMYCVAENDPESAVAFMQAMYADQPAETTTGLTDEEIAAIAAAAGATNSAECIAAGTYRDFVGAMTEKTPVAPGSAGIGTPTIAVNGAAIANSTLPAPEELATLFP